jgi:hypothetical protein
MQSQTRSSVVAVTMLTLVLSAAGCGGGDGGGPEDQFLGRWFYEAPDPTTIGSTGFTLTCTDPIFGQVFPASAMTPFLIFSSMNFEHGELADLVDTAGNCNILNYDVKGNSATVPNPDPYADDKPACLFQFNLQDTNGYPIQSFAVISPSSSWTFKLLPDKTAGGARRAQLVGSASAHLLADDGSATGAISNPDCTFAGQDTFFRLTQP